MKNSIFTVLFFLSSFLIVLTNCDEETPVKPTQPTTPVVNILSPKDNDSFLEDSVSIEVSATDDKGIVKVEVYIDNIIFEMFTVPPFKTMWDTRFLADGSAHTIYAKAYDGDDNVSSSKVITVYIYRFQPSNLIAEFLTDTRISLRWNDNSSVETGFEIEQSTNKNNFIKIKDVNADTISTVIQGMFYSDSSYYFRVRAIKNSEVSNYSNIDSVTFSIPAPENLTFVSLSKSEVEINWIDNCEYETGYIIERDENNFGYTEIGEVGENATSFINGNLIFDNNYKYRVKTKTTHNTSDFSNIIQIESGFWFELINRMDAHYYGVEALDYDGDGTFLVSCGQNAIKVWDGTTGSLIRNIDSPNNNLLSVALSPDAQFVAGGNIVGNITIWNFNNGAVIKNLNVNGAVSCLEFSDDGAYLIAGSNDLNLWHTSNWSLVFKKTEIPGNYETVDISPNEQYIAGASGGSGSDNNLHVWTINGNLVNVLSGHTHPILSISFIDENRIVSGGVDRMMKVWNFTTGTELLSYLANTRISAVDYKDNLILNTVYSGHWVDIYDLERNEVYKQFIDGFIISGKFNTVDESFSIGLGNTYIEMYKYEFGWLIVE